MKQYRVNTILYVKAENEDSALAFFHKQMENSGIEVVEQYTKVDDPNCCNQGCGCHD